MIIILAGWIIFFLLIYVAGLAFKNIFYSQKNGLNFFDFFWLGFFSLITILQTISLFFPLNVTSWYIVLILIIVAVFLTRKRFYFKLEIPKAKFSIKSSLQILVFILITLT